MVNKQLFNQRNWSRFKEKRKKLNISRKILIVEDSGKVNNWINPINSNILNFSKFLKHRMLTKESAEFKKEDVSPNKKK